MCGAEPSASSRRRLAIRTARAACGGNSSILKILAMGSDLVEARITTMDVWSGTIRQLAPPARNPDCPCCVRREFIDLEDSGDGLGFSGSADHHHGCVERNHPPARAAGSQSGLPVLRAAGIHLSG